MTVETAENNTGTALQEKEPLLDESTSRWCMFPIRYNSIWEYYKKAEASFWTGAHRTLSLCESVSILGGTCTLMRGVVQFCPAACFVTVDE